MSVGLLLLTTAAITSATTTTTTTTKTTATTTYSSSSTSNSISASAAAAPTATATDLAVATTPTVSATPTTPAGTTAATTTTTTIIASAQYTSVSYEARNLEGWVGLAKSQIMSPAGNSNEVPKCLNEVVSIGLLRLRSSAARKPHSPECKPSIRAANALCQARIRLQLQRQVALTWNLEPFATISPSRPCIMAQSKAPQACSARISKC